VLAALLANNQNVVRPGILQFDHGGGGAIGPRYDIVDYVSALQTFQEIPGEHPVARVARRQRHVVEHVEGFRQLRERREGAAFLAGATLAESAAAEQMDALQGELARVIAALDEANDRRLRAEAELDSRGGRFASGVGVGLVLGMTCGVALGTLLASRKRSV